MRFFLLLLFSAIAVNLPQKLNAEKPFDFASTPGKLPKTVVPEKYSIRIKPDLEKLTFSGSEAIKIEVRQPVRELVLNALEVEIKSAAIDEKTLPPAALKLDAKQETLKITLTEELSAGTHTLSFSFNGKINQQGQGLYYARYREEKTNAPKIMLGTQFEATDARRLFPCWDEPSFRARFQLTAVVPVYGDPIDRLAVLVRAIGIAFVMLHVHRIVVGLRMTTGYRFNNSEKAVQKVGPEKGIVNEVMPDAIDVGIHHQRVNKSQDKH